MTPVRPPQDEPLLERTLAEEHARGWPNAEPSPEQRAQLARLIQANLDLSRHPDTMGESEADDCVGCGELADVILTAGWRSSPPEASKPQGCPCQGTGPYHFTSMCRMDHPIVGFNANEWSDEGCPVCDTRAVTARPVEDGNPAPSFAQPPAAREPSDA